MNNIEPFILFVSNQINTMQLLRMFEIKQIISFRSFSSNRGVYIKRKKEEHIQDFSLIIFSLFAVHMHLNFNIKTKYCFSDLTDFNIIEMIYERNYEHKEATSFVNHHE
jgi:hypothetical protein